MKRSFSSRKYVMSCSSTNKFPFSEVPVYVRVKPFGAGGGGGESEFLTKKNKKNSSALKFDETSINAKSHTFTFPKRVIQPSEKQTETFKIVMPDLIEKFYKGIEVNILLYGQTGSGKTHTVFGPPNCLSSAIKKSGKKKGGFNENNENYGIFVRTAFQIFNHIEGLKGKWLFSGSLIELYWMEIKDLLNNKRSGHYDAVTRKPIGCSEWILDSKEKILKFASLSETRATNGTLINDSSSRSHCITTLKLTHLNGDGNIESTRIRFFDLGGSERAKDAHGSKNDMGVKNHTAGIEGICINMGLSSIVWSAEKMPFYFGKKSVRKGKSFIRMNPFVLCPCVVDSLDGSFNGTAMTCVIITVSQAPSNELQSKLALRVGRSFSKMPYVLKKIKSVPWKSVMMKYEKELKKCKEMIKNSASQKYVFLRKTLKWDLENRIMILKALRDVKERVEDEDVNLN